MVLRIAQWRLKFCGIKSSGGFADTVIIDYLVLVLFGHEIIQIY